MEKTPTKFLTFCSYKINTFHVEFNNVGSRETFNIGKMDVKVMMDYLKSYRRELSQCLEQSIYCPEEKIILDNDLFRVKGKKFLQLTLWYNPAAEIHKFTVELAGRYLLKGNRDKLFTEGVKEYPRIKLSLHESHQELIDWANSPL